MPHVRPANVADLPVMERLWLMFSHDLSEFSGARPAADGTFRSERLHSAFRDPDWAPYLISDARHPIGLALVRGLKRRTRILSGFFIVRGARRNGNGLSAVRTVLDSHPGPWEIAFQDDNAPATRFWHRVATDLSGDAWTEEKRPVPGRPDLPPDTWLRLRAGNGGTGNGVRTGRDLEKEER